MYYYYYYQGNVGILDISTRNYTTVMRSHVGRVLSASVDSQRRHIATVSDDRTIRIWDFDTLQQVLTTVSGWLLRCILIVLLIIIMFL